MASTNLHAAPVTLDRVTYIGYMSICNEGVDTNYIGLGLFSNSILGILADIRPRLASKIIFTGHCGVIPQCKIMVVITTLF